MAGKDLYAALGLTRSASAAEIKKAYRRLARKYHPDVNPGNAAAEAKFKEISSAADVLGDETKRKLYDKYGEAALAAGFDAARAEEAERRARTTAGGPFGGSGIPFDFEVFGGGGRGGPTGAPGFDFEDLLGALGGRGRGQRRPARGEDVQLETTISFASAVRGTTLTLPVRTRRPCSECGGSGHVDRGVCSACRGSGEVVASEKVKVRIPEGVDDGTKVRVAGKGGGAVGNAAAGDLFVVVRVEPHPYFQRKGDDIWTEVPVTVAEAYLGAEIEIPTIQGAVRARIPAGTSSGQKFRLRGRGVRNQRTKANGDHVYRLEVQVPKVLTDAGRSAAEKLDPLYGGSVRASLPKRLEDAE